MPRFIVEVQTVRTDRIAVAAESAEAAKRKFIDDGGVHAGSSETDAEVSDVILQRPGIDYPATDPEDPRES